MGTRVARSRTDWTDWAAGGAAPNPRAVSPGRPAADPNGHDVTQRRKGVLDWLPPPLLGICLVIGVIGWVLFVVYAVPRWANGVRDPRCNPPQPLQPSPSASVLGLPDSAAKLSPELGISRGVAEDSISWPAGSGAPNHGAYSARSSALLHAGGGRYVPTDAVSSWIQIDGGTSVLTVCVDSSSTHGGLSNGTFAGFASIPTSDPAKTLTVREELSVQSTYVGYFWPLALFIIAFGLWLHADKLTSAPKPLAYLAVITGAGTFVGVYYGTALSNPSWGGLRSIGTLVAALFTATIGAIATVAATGSSGASTS